MSQELSPKAWEVSGEERMYEGHWEEGIVEFKGVEQLRWLGNQRHLVLLGHLEGREWRRRGWQSRQKPSQSGHVGARSPDITRQEVGEEPLSVIPGPVVQYSGFSGHSFPWDPRQGSISPQLSPAPNERRTMSIREKPEAHHGLCKANLEWP